MSDGVTEYDWSWWPARHCFAATVGHTPWAMVKLAFAPGDFYKLDTNRNIGLLLDDGRRIAITCHPLSTDRDAMIYAEAAYREWLAAVRDVMGIVSTEQPGAEPPPEPKTGMTEFERAGFSDRMESLWATGRDWNARLVDARRDARALLDEIDRLASENADLRWSLAKHSRSLGSYCPVCGSMRFDREEWRVIHTDDCPHVRFPPRTTTIRGELERVPRPSGDRRVQWDGIYPDEKVNDGHDRD